MLDSKIEELRNIEPSEWIDWIDNRIHSLKKEMNNLTIYYCIMGVIVDIFICFRAWAEEGFYSLFHILLFSIFVGMFTFCVWVLGCDRISNLQIFKQRLISMYEK